jgi:cobalamin biosynthesis protein CobT
VATYFLQLHS